MLWGDRRDRALADWGRGDGQKLLRVLGFTHGQTPWAATVSHVRRQWDAPLVEATLGAWAERVLTALPPAPGEPEAVAIAEKTRRGCRTPGAPATPRLSGLSHRWGLTLWPQAVADKTNELPVLEDGLRALVVEGRVITVEALLTQGASAERLVHGGGDDVMLVNGNHPQRPHEMPLVFQEAHAAAETVTTAELVDSGHGRREPRRLTARAALVGYRDWPGLAHVFARERRVTMQKHGEQRPEVGYGGTSLRLDQAAPERWRGVGRQHWQIENHVHGVREVTCDEARSHVRWGSIPQGMAAFRNPVTGLRHWAGETTRAAACRRFATPPGLA